MGQEEGSGEPELVGRPVAEAVEVVLEDDSRDRERVRATLEAVAEDGVVSEAAAEAVERSLDAVSGTANGLATGKEAPAEPGVVWADATLRARGTGLLFASVRAELAGLRAWPGLDEAGVERLDGLEARLDGRGERCSDLEGQLDELAQPVRAARRLERGPRGTGTVPRGARGGVAPGGSLS